VSLVQRHGWRLRLDWTQVATRYLPFADAASSDLPLPRLLRLSLFQVSVGMVTALIVGTLNRVMIFELGVGAWLVAGMVGLALLVAPLRALIGFRSDHHRSPLGWRRLPYLWLGTLAMFGGLAIMPFALVLLSGTTPVQLWAGHGAAALAFLLAGLGVQTVQTTGLALATDLAAESTRPRVVALMYVMLLLGMVGAGLVFGSLLQDYSHTRLVQVVQGVAVLTVLLNLCAAWKQEPRDRARGAALAQARRQGTPRESFVLHWQRFAGQGRVLRFLLTVGLGTAAFNMQDIILEPYGGEVMGLGVAATTQLTALSAAGALLAFAGAARWLTRGADPHRVAALGLVVGVFAFSAVIFAEPLDAPSLFRAGTVLLGLGGGLFAVGTLSAAMQLSVRGNHGLVLGAWGAVQATCTGLAVALGGGLRDAVGHLAQSGALGEVLATPVTGYALVFHLELFGLFAALIALGPLVQRTAGTKHLSTAEPARLGLAEFPG
jgi:MFS transporter, BCD family, chlorophyll transporter